MNRQVTLDKKQVNDDTDCYVIAEIGHNHQGDIDQCIELFKTAKRCGADAVKLQKRDNKNMFSKELYDGVYDNPNSYGKTYGEHREFLEFGLEKHKVLIDCAKDLNITFFSTPFDMNSADFLESLDMPLYKIASGDLLNIPLIKHVASFGKPLIVSTGGGSLEDVKRVYDAVMPINEQLVILQCTSAYPAQPDQLNLRVIRTFRDQFPDIVIGYSGHDNGVSLPLVAYMLGARVIEKHFTLDRSLKGTDHAFSLAPSGLRRMVRDLRRARSALGLPEKVIDEAERAPIYKMGKKLVASRDLREGHILAEDDIAIKSPGGGMPPYEFNNVVGRALKQSLCEDDAITLEVLDGKA